MFSCVIRLVKLLIFALSDTFWMKSTFFNKINIVTSEHRRLIKSFHNILLTKLYLMN